MQAGGTRVNPGIVDPLDTNAHGKNVLVEHLRLNIFANQLQQLLFIILSGMPEFREPFDEHAPWDNVIDMRASSVAHNDLRHRFVFQFCRDIVANLLRLLVSPFFECSHLCVGLGAALRGPDDGSRSQFRSCDYDAYSQFWGRRVRFVARRIIDHPGVREG